MHETSDQPLQDSFTRCWVKVQPTVTAYLYSLIRNTHDAEDVLQEVATVALADFASYDRERPFLPWALGIARLRALHHFRRRSHDRLVFSEAALDALAEAHTLVHETAGRRRQALQECLKQLSQRGRRALELRYGDDLPVHVVAQHLTVTANATALLLHKVRRRLAECIVRRVSLSEGAR